MAIRLHALTALMLADFCLTDFFQVTHGGVQLGVREVIGRSC